MKFKRIIGILVLFIMTIMYVNMGITTTYAKDIELTDEEKEFISHHQVIRIGVDPKFSPYEFIDNDGDYKGMAADYLHIIEERTGITFQVIDDLAWEEVYDMAINGDVDMLPCVGKTNREKYFDFTDSYIKFQRVIMSRKSGPVYDFDDLSDIRVGVQRNSSHYSFLHEFEDIDLQLYTSNDALLLALSSGEIDVMVSNYASAIYRSKEIGVTDVKVDEVIDISIDGNGRQIDNTTNELAMAVNKELKPLVSIINKVLESMTEEEKVHIRNTWIGTVEATDYTKIIQSIAIAAIIIGMIITMFLVYSHLLRKEIKRRKIIEEELVIAKVHAEKANEAKSMFLAHMSHEIRTPLNAVTGLAFLLENTKTSQIQKKYIKNIKDASYNLLGIINDILDFSKIEAGEVDIESVEFSLDHLLDKVGNLLMPKATVKGLGFHVKKDVRLSDILVSDPTRIEQVLINLVNNAIKFTKEGSVNIDVYMEEENLNGYQIRFTVKDSGIGIPKEQKEQLFTPFRQLDSSVTRKYGGTGLGLSISRKLVHLLGGEITVKSDVGIGSSFMFSIPVKAKRKVKDRVVYPDFRKINVLLFDEDSESTQIVGEYLESYQMSVTIVTDYQNALQEIVTGRYQLLIMELNIGGVDSIEFAEAYAGHMTIIFLAKQVRETQYEQAQAIGVKHIIMKPIIASILYNSLVQSFIKDYEEEAIEIEVENQVNDATILLVEDNEVNQMIAKEILEQHGYEIVIAENGQIAVDFIKSGQTVDMILMDIHMPVMDGYEATQQIRDINKVVPILAMTAVSFSNIESKCLAVGMNDYVSKPVEPEKLFATIDKNLKKVMDKPSNQGPMTIEERLKQVTKDSYIDIKQGLMRIGNNETLYYEVLRKFYDDTVQSKDQVTYYINNQQNEEAMKLVHKVKGTSGNVGAVNLYQSAKTLMEVLINNYEVDLGPYIWEYETDLANTLNTIAKMLKEVTDIKHETHQSKYQLSDEEEQLVLRLKELLKNADLDAFGVFDRICEKMNCTDKKWLLIKEKMDGYQFEEAYKLIESLL